MMKGDIYYKHKNTVLSLAGIPQASPVYSADANVIPAFNNVSDAQAVYVNAISGLAADTAITIQINGSTVDTVYTIDDSGHFFYYFNPPKGVFSITAITPAGAKYSQQFRASNLHLLWYTQGQLWYEQIHSNLVNSGGNFMSPPTSPSTSVLPGMCTTQQLNNNWGGLLDFPKPEDWTEEEYRDCLAGSTDAGKPGIFKAILEGATTGGTKDVIKSVTGVTIADSDMRGLANLKWITPLSTVRYTYDWVNHVVVDNDPHADQKASGGGLNGGQPHCFTALNGAPLYEPNYADKLNDSIAYAGGTSMRAHTLEIDIAGAVRTVSAMPITSTGNIDSLGYTWLSPWSAHTQIATTQEAVSIITSTSGSISAEAELGSLRVYANGLLLSANLHYTISGTTITFNFDITDYSLWAVYSPSGTTGFSRLYTVASADLTEIQLTAPDTFLLSNAVVFHNGLALETTALYRGTGDTNKQVTVTAAIKTGDILELQYRTGSTPYLYSQTSSYIDFLIALAYPLYSDTAEVYVNGIKQLPSSYYFDGTTLAFNDSSTLSEKDRITIIGELKTVTGGNVAISWTSGGTTYIPVQGLDFKVNYTTGQISWQMYSGAVIPSSGTSIQVTFAYFPEEILKKLLGYVRPAHVIFTRIYKETIGTNTLSYNSKTWNGFSIATEIIA